MLYTVNGRNGVGIKMTVHELKCIQPYFRDMWHGHKTFDIRKNDRNFQLGDILHLREYYPPTENEIWFGFATEKCIIKTRLEEPEIEIVPERYGLSFLVKVEYILDGHEWLQPGYVCLGIKKVDI
jgi:uncharacterized protein DUF3850